jgi:hypothetical protein
MSEAFVWPKDGELDDLDVMLFNFDGEPEAKIAFIKAALRDGERVKYCWQCSRIVLAREDGTLKFHATWRANAAHTFPATSADLIPCPGGSSD